jgi:hypothetical protein
MLRSLKALHGYTVLASDGEVGKVHDFCFHDDTWATRYLVVATGHWLSGRKVLLTTRALGRPNWADLSFPVALTREQVEQSPEIDTDKPVSRQHEVALHQHYGWPFYWLEPGFGDWPPFVPVAPIPTSLGTPPAASKANTDLHLRSIKAVTGYHIHARNGAVGHVEDFIVDDTLWVIRYLVAHTGRFLPAKKVLLAPEWLGEIRYAERQVNVTLTREAILNCPEFYPGAGVNREYEERVYDYYGRPTYWEDAAPLPQSK